MSPPGKDRLCAEGLGQRDGIIKRERPTTQTTSKKKKSGQANHARTGHGRKLHFGLGTLNGNVGHLRVCHFQSDGRAGSKKEEIGRG